MADAVVAILVMVAVYALIGILTARFVKLLHYEGEIRTRKTEARWPLLTIVWPIIPVILVFWVVGGAVFLTWESLTNLLHDAQLVKRN